MHKVTLSVKIIISGGPISLKLPAGTVFKYKAWTEKIK
jgi:hypothetical protein